MKLLIKIYFAAVLAFISVNAYAQVNVSSFTYFQSLVTGVSGFDILMTSNIIFTSNLGASQNGTINGGIFTLDGSNNTGFVLNNSQLAVSNLTFESFSKTVNTVNSVGGSVFNISDSTLTLTNVTIQNSQGLASQSRNISGGAVYASNSALYLNDVTFSSNNVHIIGDWSGTSGGAMYIENFSQAVFGGLTTVFEDNYSRGMIYGSHGGAVYADNSSLDFNAVNTIFANSLVVMQDRGGSNTNWGQAFGGAIYGKNSVITFANSVSFSTSSAFAGERESFYARGGAIYVENSTLTFSGTAMFNNSSAAILYTWDSVYYGDASGGAIYADNSVINFASVTFNDSSANAQAPSSAYGAFGGALYAAGNAALINFNGPAYFTFNQSVSSGGAVSNGGAIYSANGAQINFLNESVFIGNNTFGSGGAIYNNNNGDINFINSAVIFSSNTAYQGGAVYNGGNSFADFASSLVNFINNSADIGGAIYAFNGSNTNFGGGEVNFLDNEAGDKGGALYISGSAIIFDTDGGTVTFTGNKAGGKPNDVYMDAGAQLNISGSNAIKFEGGILSDTSGTGIEINKSGTGAMYLGGENQVWGDFNISGGDIVMLASATYMGKALELGSASALDMHNATVNKVEVNGNFESKTDLKMDIFSNGDNDEIKAGSAVINGNIDIFAGVGTYNNKEYELIITSNNLTGIFISSSINSRGINYEIRYGGGIVRLIVDGIVRTDFGALKPLTYNQSQTASAFDKMSVNPGNWGTILTDMKSKLDSNTASSIAEVKNFLAQTSGYFLANVIRNIAADSPNNEVYDKIRGRDAGMPRGEVTNNNSGLWVQLKGGVESFKKDENSLEDYRDMSMGVMFGFDGFLEEQFAGGDIMWGVYGRINKDNIEQGKHKADGNKNGLGLYGGYIKEGWELKAMLLGSYDRFNTERMTYGGQYAKGEIKAMTVSADLEGSIRIRLTEDMKLKPYGAIEAESVMYGGFKERGAGQYNLDTKEGSYLRSAARAGMGLDYERGIWIWYANAEGKYIIEGTKPEIDSEFERTGADFKSRGTEEGKIEMGIGTGGEVRIGEKWKAFANVKYYSGERYENMYGNIGVRYLIGEKKENNAAEGYIKEAKANTREAERLSDEALEMSNAALNKIEKAKEKEKEMDGIDEKREKEQIYILKEAIDRSEEAVIKAEEAFNKTKEVQKKAEAAKEYKTKAEKEGYGVKRNEKKELDNMDVTIEETMNKTNTAKRNALRAKAEAYVILERLEEERTKNEESEREREEAKIKKELATKN
ncbi:MAG: autotransporter domain-containing protein [Endomicrobia bacterium]|nr:autotransporter domain-containing protein [Endomicrobiia bacterium]